MLIYNVTTIVDDRLASQWQEWMELKHIPDVMRTGLFQSFNFLKVLDSPNEGVTFCTQFIAETQSDYQKYIEEHAPMLREETKALFGENALSFRSLMEYVGKG